MRAARVLIDFMCPATAFVLASACGHDTRPQPVAAPTNTISFRPSLTVGKVVVYRIEASLELTAKQGGSEVHEHATLESEDRVEVVAPNEVREHLSTLDTRGTGQLGDALKRIAKALDAVVVDTRFDEHWQVASSIEGTSDDEVRTMVMNLTPVLSFRLLPSHPVSKGDTWTNEWSGALKSEHGSASGQVATAVRYTLRSIDKCGVEDCATIVAEGNDQIPSEGSTTQASLFRGEQRVEIPTAIPIWKQIESTTRLHAEQAGEAVEYVNVVTVRVQRVDH